MITRRLGEIDFDEDSVFRFPFGLPGFENQHSFIFVRRPDMEPILFMQSTTDEELCFILVPILVADPEYHLELTPEDAEELLLPQDRQPRIGEEILCAAIVCAGENATPTVNLMAPIVVNIKDRIGAQVIRVDSGYSHRAPLFRAEQPACS